MAETNNINVPGSGNNAERAKEIKTDTAIDLKLLKEQVAAGEVTKVLDTLIGKISEWNGEIPQERMNTFINSLTDAEREKFATLLISGQSDPRVQKLRERAAKEVAKDGKNPLPALPNINPGALMIEKFLDDTTGKLDLSALDNIVNNPMLTAFGLGGGKDLLKGGAVKSILLGVATKFVESAAKALSSFGPAGAQVLETALGLRLLQMQKAGKMTPQQIAKYEQEYRKWMEDPIGNPPNPASVNKPKVVEAAKPAAADALTLKVTDKPVIGKLLNGTEVAVLVKDGKLSMKTGDKAAEITLPATVDATSIVVRQPVADKPGAVEYKLTTGATISLNLTKLQAAIASEYTEITASDESKILLTKVLS